jgi:hypothetical protein
MDIIRNNQKAGETVPPQKPQTQQDADTLQRQEVTELANKHKMLDANLLAGLVRKSNRILVTISTHRLPFDLFPDTVNIEEGRITIINRRYFLWSEMHSVDIKDISNILINTTPFFAQLIIVSNTFAKNEIKIQYLRKKEAVFARRIIEGLRVFENNHIDTSNYTKEELLDKLEELSTTAIVT